MAGLRGVMPAMLHESCAHTPPWQINIGGSTLGTPEVFKGIYWTRRPVSIGAKDRQSWVFQQWSYCAQHIWHAGWRGESIASIYHPFWFELRKCGDPLNFISLPWNHLQVGDVENIKLFLTAQSAWFKQRHGYFLKLEFGQFRVTPRESRNTRESRS